MNVLLVGFYPKTEKIISTGDDKPEYALIDKEIKSFMAKWGIHGGAVAYLKNNKLVYSKGFGFADSSDRPATADQLFRIASLSKPITAVAIMKLIEEGKISMNSKVFGKNGILAHMDYSQLRDKKIMDIAISHLLTHTSGWDKATSACGDPMFDPLNIAKCMNQEGPASSETIIQYMLTQPLQYSPGEKYAYSNFGYSVLGRVIEKVSGKSYEQYVKEDILSRLKIKDMMLAKTQFCDRRANEVCYFDEGGKTSPSVCDPSKYVPYPYGGFNIDAMDSHGGWLASVNDLARFLSGINSIIKPEMYQQMIVPSTANKYYGCGWSVNEHGNIWHTGSLVGSSSMMALVKKGSEGWVLLFNSNPMSKEYFREMDQLMWKAIQKLKTNSGTI